MSSFVEKGKPTRLVVAEKGNNTHTTYGIAVADPDYQIRWREGLPFGPHFGLTALSLLLVPASFPLVCIWNASRERNARSVTAGARRVMQGGKRSGKTTGRS